MSTRRISSEGQHCGEHRGKSTKRLCSYCSKREATVAARDAIFDWTALHGATIKERKEVVELLLQEKGADVNLEDRDKGTALHRQRRRGIKRL
jgi:ankyrin repeat protein